MTRNELIKAITTEARALYEQHGEVDSALIAEKLGDHMENVFGADWIEASFDASTDCAKQFHNAIADGIERALIAKYDALIDKHDLPEGDAWEAIHSDISDDARREVSDFICEWEAAGI